MIKQIEVIQYPTRLRFSDDGFPCPFCPFKADDTGGNMICCKTGWIGSDSELYSVCPFRSTEVLIPDNELVMRFISLVRAKYPSANLWVENDDDGDVYIYHDRCYSDPNNEPFLSDVGGIFWVFFGSTNYTTVHFVYNDLLNKKEDK